MLMKQIRKKKVSRDFAFTVIILIGTFFGIATWFVGEEVIDDQQQAEYFKANNKQKPPVSDTGTASTVPVESSADGTVAFEDADLGIRLTARDNFPAKPLVETICPYKAVKAYNPTEVILLGQKKLSCETAATTQDSTGYYASQDPEVVLVYPHDLTKCRSKNIDATEKRACAVYDTQAKVGDHGYAASGADAGMGVGYWVKPSANSVVFLQTYDPKEPQKLKLRNVSDMYRVWIQSTTTAGTDTGRNPFASVCAQDAKQCPDGSYVVRDGAKQCEFAACPAKKAKPTKATTNTAPDATLVP